MTATIAPIVYTIKVYGVAVSDFIVDTEFRASWGKHDLWFVRCNATKSQSKKTIATWTDGAPVEILWGRGPGNTNTWYGYVNHHVFSSQDDESIGVVQVTYVLIGTSRVMNTEHSKQWTSVSYSWMAQSIAKSNGFRCVFTQTTQLVTETQASESDFAFLNRMAEKMGFRFWCSGATLYFIDPQVLLTGFTYLAVPSYSINLNQTTLDTARLFEKTQGGNLPGAVIGTRQISGFDGNTGRVLTLTAGSGATQLAYTDRHVQSYNEGQQAINARQALAQFWITATVEVFGNIMLYPGKMIQLDGDAMPYESAGTWLISGVIHVMAPGGTTSFVQDRYVTKLTLLRNVQAMPILKDVLRIQPEFVPCSLISGQWRSTVLSSIRDGVVGAGYVSAQ
jgi:hypothetical protein